MIMEATSATGWNIPVPGVNDPWTSNPDHQAGVYICFDPTVNNPNPNDPLWLSFDLKQFFKTTNANTNFRVTVNGNQVGTTYRPPFAGGTPVWQKIYVNLTAYKGSNIQIGLESSVAEPFANGTGTANLVDNIRIQRLNPSGLSNEQFQRGISVYPNPSKGFFSVSVGDTKAYELEVTDLTGKVILKQSVKDSNLSQLDLSGNAQGVYLLKITSKEASAIQKIVIQ